MSQSWLVNNILDTIAPARCGRCDQEGHWWCRPPGTIPPWPICLKCRKPWHTKQTDTDCQAEIPIVYLGPYADPSFRTMLYHWKYLGQWAISLDWAKLLATTLQTGQFLPGILVPIPAHWSRQLTRGYNQAMVFAQQMAQATGWPMMAALRRTRATKPQAELDTNQRIINLQRAFAVRPQSMDHNQPIWLVDDIVTSGATIQAARAVFDNLNQKVVGVIAVALAGLQDSDKHAIIS